MPESHSHSMRASLSWPWRTLYSDMSTPLPHAPRTDSLARYDALLRISPQLAHHRSIGELVHVLADHLHTVVPFDYLALILHDADTEQMKLNVLAPPNIPRPPFDTMPVASGGPASRVWQSQLAAVIPVPPTDTLGPGMDFIRSLGQQVTCWLPLTTVHARIGVLTFASSCASDYAAETVAFMEQVAAHVAVAVDNAINFERARELSGELRVERDRLRMLLEVGNLLVSHLDYAALLKEIS